MKSAWFAHPNESEHRQIGFSGVYSAEDALPQNSAHNTVESMNIRETIATLDRMQADRVVGKYALGGAVGAYFYVEVTYTEDIDAFVSLNPKPGRLLVSLEDVHSYLKRHGWTIDRDGYSVIAGWKVQFLPAEGPLLIEALEQSEERHGLGAPVHVFSAEHLMAIALKVGRPKDRARLLQFLETKRFDERKLSEILTRHGLLDAWAVFKKVMTG
jgi:hypothetical protein